MDNIISDLCNSCNQPTIPNSIPIDVFMSDNLLMAYLHFYSVDSSQPSVDFSALTLDELISKSIFTSLPLHHYSRNKQSSFELSSDMHITGTPPIIDKQRGHFILTKCSTSSTLADIRKQKQHSVPALVLALWQYLLPQASNLQPHILFINKSGSQFKSTIVPQSEYLPIQTVSSDELSEMVEHKLWSLSQQHSLNQLPERCKSIRWTTRRGKKIPVTCHSYCAVNHICPHYRKKSFTDTIMDITDISTNSGTAKLGI